MRATRNAPSLSSNPEEMTRPPITNPENKRIELPVTGCQFGAIESFAKELFCGRIGPHEERLTARAIVAWCLLHWGEVEPSLSQDIRHAESQGLAPMELWGLAVQDPKPFDAVTGVKVELSKEDQRILRKVGKFLPSEDRRRWFRLAETLLSWAFALWIKVHPRIIGDLHRFPWVAEWKEWRVYLKSQGYKLA
jgi:hypothetical protein